MLGFAGRSGPLADEEAAGGDVVLVAGGIGLAPLRPVSVMLEHAATWQVVLLYGARTPEIPLSAASWRVAQSIDVEVTVDARRRLAGGSAWSPS